MRLLLLASLLMIFTGRAAGQTLHLLLVSDVEDAQFGMISLQDEERMARLFGTAEKGLGYKMQPIYLNKANFTGKAVRNTITKLEVQPNDIIVFFYSGLGYYPATSKSQFPFLQVKDWQKKPLSLDEVGTLLQAKGVRFCMAMADCRNESLILEPEIVHFDDYVRTFNSYKNLVLNCLFLKKTGLMTIASAARNQNALVVTTSEMNGNTGDTTRRNIVTGSLFTRLFASEFDRMDITNPNNIAQASFDTLLQRVKLGIPSILNPTPTTKRTQTVIWKNQPYAGTVPSKITEYLTWDYAKNLDQLEATLNQLKTFRDTNRRKALISALIELYSNPPPGVFANWVESWKSSEVKRINWSPPIVILNKSQELSFKDYLKRLSVFDPMITKIKILNTELREESILDKSLTLRIMEKRTKP